MDRLDDRVRRCREETVDLMRPRHRLRLGAAITVERRLYPGKGEQGSLIIEREPHLVLLFGLLVRLGRVFGEAVRRHEAAMLWCQPDAPVDEVVLRILLTGGPPIFGSGGMPQRIVTSSVTLSVLHMTGAG